MAIRLVLSDQVTFYELMLYASEVFPNVNMQCKTHFPFDPPTQNSYYVIRYERHQSMHLFAKLPNCKMQFTKINSAG